VHELVREQMLPCAVVRPEFAGAEVNVAAPSEGARLQRLRGLRRPLSVWILTPLRS